MNDHKFKNQREFTYNPFEIGFVGYSNSGKTTLISNLIGSFSKHWNIGYVKHASKYFEMDQKGKDTDVVAKHGAKTILINDPNHAARIDYHNSKNQDLLDLDVVFVEGYKDLPIPKIVLVDEDQKILKEAENNRLTNIIGFVHNENSDLNDIQGIPSLVSNDIKGIAELVEKHFESMVKAIPLHGIVLTGGKSKRMKMNKAGLNYHGRTQTEHLFNLLSSYCEKVFVSCRADQANQDPFDSFPQIIDRLSGFGPIAGILSPMLENPNAAWLVVACDLPFVVQETLSDLIEKRNAFKFATAYKSTHDNLPEPLCAIYEPKSYANIMRLMGTGLSCPRKIMINSEIGLLDQIDKKWLDNVNYPEEHEKALEHFATEVKK